MGIGKPGRGSSLTKGFPKPCQGHGAQGQVAAALVPHCHPETGGDTSVEQLRPCMNRARPVPFAWRPQAGALPFPSSLALDQPRQHPSSTSQPPVPPSRVQLWDVRSRVLCQGLSGCRSPESPPALGPGGDTGSPDLATLTQHPGTTTDPPRTLHRLLPPPTGSSGGATPTPKPGDTPAPAGDAPEGSSRRCCAFGFALLAFHVLVQTPPPRTDPGQGVGSALLYPCPSKGMVGWNRDGRQRIAGLGNFSYHEMAILYVMRCVL